MFEKLKNGLTVLRAGLNQLTSKPITYNFPPEMPIAKKSRGRHILNLETCKGCKLCAKICPNDAIEMVDRAAPDQSQKDVAYYPQIDFSRCCFCGLCVDVCPTESLQMTNFPVVIGPDKSKFIFSPEMLAQPPELMHPEDTKITDIVSWARSRSLWVLNYFTGCCFIEAVPWVSSGFDMERFGLIVADSPRHADVLLIGGYVTVKTLRRIIRIYQQMPTPKFVLSFGNCPMSGGTYWDSYNTIKQIDKYIPVDVWIAGCPPRPEPIGVAIVAAMKHIQNGYTGKEEEAKLTEKLEVPPFSRQEKLNKNEFLIPFGPQHPGSGNFNLKLKVNGEIVIEATPQVGYLHRGFEKLMEYRTWYQNAMLIQRVCVLDGASYEIAYIGAVEKIANLDAPERAKYLRVIQAELSRIQSHLLNLGLITGAAGFKTMQMITWGDREKFLRLLDELTGSRIYHVYNVPGGVFRDLTDTFIELALKTIKYMRHRLSMYDKLLMKNSTFKARTMDIGNVSSDVAIENDITGPNARASGVNFDVRKNHPYAVYGELDFDSPTFKEGDAYHRTLDRRLEIGESLNIVEDALNKLPPGSFRKKFAPLKRVPEGEALHCVESARGELCFHLISTGTNTPYRAKIRGPTFDPILVLLPELLKGCSIADVPVIYWSLDQCPADHDR
ncbi:MAG: NADH-quinone oxidoreductase subunit D [Promethearchaeota archaeon]